MANLKFTSTGSTTVKLIAVGRPQQNIFTANNSPYTLGTEMSLGDGDTIQFSGQGNNLSLNDSNYYIFVTTGTGTLAVEGDLKSLIGNSDYVKSYQFFNLFKGCSNITNISGLVFPPTVADFCFSNMFLNCTGLVNASTTLPATILARWCYNSMFGGCSALTSAPSIAGTTIAPFCFYSMFYGCSSLKDAPAIIARNMDKQFACNGMFRGCTSLSSVTVSITGWSTAQNENKNWLYGVASQGTFNKPTTLASIPAGVKPDNWTVVNTYPSIIVAQNQIFTFDAMQESLDVQTLAYSYNGTQTMTFNFDSSLLPSGVTFSNGSFTGNGLDMNYNTPTYTSVIPITLSTTAVDAVPVTINATINLVDIPTATISIATIPAISWNFEEENATSSINLLQYVTYDGNGTLSTEIIGTLPEGVTYQNGILSANKDNMGGDVNITFDLIAYASDARAVTQSNISLAIEGLGEESQPLTFKAVNGSANIQFTRLGATPTVSLSYSLDNGATWSSYPTNQIISLAEGESVMFSGNNSAINTSNDWYNGNIHQFKMTGYVEARGNTNSIINYASTISDYNFYGLFYGCSGLVRAAALPSKEVGEYSYSHMFYQCSSLLDAPKDLPATTLKGYCYKNMFYGCWALTGVPTELPATTLYGYCYQGMFNGCGQLKDSPHICANNFSGNYSMSGMFIYCSSLSSINVDFTSWPEYTTNNWVSNVSANGTFYKSSSLNASYGVNAIPSNWTVVNK